MLLKELLQLFLIHLLMLSRFQSCCSQGSGGDLSRHSRLHLLGNFFTADQVFRFFSLGKQGVYCSVSHPHLSLLVCHFLGKRHHFIYHCMQFGLSLHTINSDLMLMFGSALLSFMKKNIYIGYSMIFHDRSDLVLIHLKV